MIDDLNLTGTLGDYANPFTDERANYFEHYSFSDYVGCSVYVPDNVNPSTRVVIAFPGGGFEADVYHGNHRQGWHGIQDYLMESGSDCIVIMPHSANGVNEDPSYWVDMVDLVKDEYGITSSGCSFSGFSQGSISTMYGMNQYLKQNPNVESQVCFVADGYDSYYYNSTGMANMVKDTFVENGTILISIEGTHSNKNYLNQYVDAGINVLRVSFKDIPLTDCTDYYGRTSSGDYDRHVATNQSLFRDQFYEFYAGTGPLPEGYIYEYYDQESGTWIEIDRNEIDTYEKLHAFYGNVVSGTNLYENKINALKSLEDVSLAVTSDSDVLGICINGVIGKIRTSNFVQNSVSFDGGFGGSTTSVPTQIPSVVSSFFDSNATFLMGLANDMSAIAQIGSSIDEINNHLAILAGELNPFGVPNEVLGNTPSEEPVNPEETPNEEPVAPENETDPVVPDETVPSEESKGEIPEDGEEPENTPEGVIPEENVPEESEPDGGIITEDGGVLEQGEGDYITEEGDDTNPNTMGDTVGGEDGETPDDNPENQNAGDGNALEPEPENNGNEDKPENQGEQPTSKPNTNGGGTTPSPNQTPNPTPGYRPFENPTPSSTPNPSPSPSQPPQNNLGFGGVPDGGNAMDINPLELFPEYSEVYSSEDMIVYNFNDEYKIVIHTDGDKIIGIEHYYDFGNEFNADNSLNRLMNQYSSNENLENIVQNDRYVKVIFDEEMYENMSIEDIRNKYSNLTEVIR